MKLLNHLARKVFRRKPKKERGERKINSSFTAAEKLIADNWGVVVSNPEPARAGVSRAVVLLTLKRKKNEKIPLTDTISRQRRRQMERLEFKMFRSSMKQAIMRGK